MVVKRKDCGRVKLWESGKRDGMESSERIVFTRNERFDGALCPKLATSTAYIRKRVGSWGRVREDLVIKESHSFSSVVQRDSRYWSTE